MSLQCIVGASGSGKSTYLYEYLIDEALQNPDGKFIILVPEQFTMHTQRELVLRHPRHSVMNIEVLSFERLAYRVFDELGTDTLTVLEDTGKSLVLRRVAEKKLDELTTLRRSIKKPGYISEMKSLISELSQYAISPDDFAEIVHKSNLPEAFRRKADDILTLYRGFQAFIRGNYITAEEILTLLISVADESAMLRAAVLVCDGYTGFTPIQNELLRTLLPIVQKLIVTATIAPDDGSETAGDFSSSILANPRPDELFLMSKKMLWKLYQMARDERISIDEPIVLPMDNPTRFRTGGELQALERNLFRAHPKRFAGELPEGAGAGAVATGTLATDVSRQCVTDGSGVAEQASASGEIAIYRLPDSREELRFAAVRIISMIEAGDDNSETAYHFRDFALVCADMEEYQNEIEEIFSAYHIPVFVDAKANLQNQPCISFLQSALSIAEENFSYESVVSFLRTGFFDAGFDTDSSENYAEMDAFENYIRSAGLRGVKKYSHPFAICPDGYEAEELVKFNALRENLMKILLPFYEAVSPKKEEPLTVRAITTALYELLVSCGVEEKLAARRAILEERRDIAKARQYEQIYGIIMDLFDKFVGILGDEETDLATYRNILDAGLDEAKIGIIPPSDDTVVFGDIERTRLEHIRVLFLLGANDGSIPKSAPDRGILSGSDRRRLKELDVELSPDEREQVFMQRFYLYQVLTKPSDRLFITYSSKNRSGEGVRQSYLIRDICRIFPRLFVRDLREISSTELARSPETSLMVLAELLRDYAERAASGRLLSGEGEDVSLVSGNVDETGTDENETAATEMDWLVVLYRQLASEFPKTVETLFEAAFFTHTDNAISLAKKQINGSVSRIEAYAKCAYSYLVKYGLNLSERQNHELRAIEFGTLYHEALERYSKSLAEKDEDWRTISAEARDEYLVNAIEDTVYRLQEAAFFDEAREKFILSRMKKTLHTTVEVLTEQVRAGRFVPQHFEVDFTEEYAILGAADNEKMLLRGTVDRLDFARKDDTPDTVYIKITDYKSGKTDFDFTKCQAGLQVQLIVYYDAIKKRLQKQETRIEAEPAALLYYTIDDPVIDAGDGDPEMVRNTALRGTGLINGATEVLALLDEKTTSGKSPYIPVSFLKEGKARATKSLLSGEDFESLRTDVSALISETGGKISRGEFPVRPYKYKKETGCTYCPYQGICGFDRKLDGFSYRVISDKVTEKVDDAAESGVTRDES